METKKNLDKMFSENDLKKHISFVNCCEVDEVLYIRPNGSDAEVFSTPDGAEYTIDYNLNIIKVECE